MSEFVYCLNTSTIRPTPLLEKIRLAGKAGYTAIEPWNDEITAYLDQGGSLAELKRALGDAGLRVVSVIALHGWITAEGAEHARVLDDCRRRMAQAAELGSPYIVASPPQEVVDLGRATERFAELLEIGKGIGVTPFHGVPRVRRRHQGRRQRLGDRVGDRRSRATVVADVFHMIRGGRHASTTCSSSQAIASRTSTSTTCPAQPDPLTQKDEDRVMVGDGIADLPRVIANLRTIGYRGPLSLELFNRELWSQDPATVIRRGIERIRALVGD